MIPDRGASTKPYSSPAPVEMQTKRRTILVFSFEPWGAMWYSKHHYAAELAKGHTVYFVSPPDKWRLRDLLSFKLELKPTPEGVIVVDYRNHLPLRMIPSFMARWMHYRTARKLSRLLEPDGNILWSFHPTPLVLQRPLRTQGNRFIYHVVDPYQSFAMDLPCAIAADLIVAVNPWFQDKYRKLNPNVLLIPHGVRSNDREQPQRFTGNYYERWSPYVVLAGGINMRLDYGLLVETMQRLPDLNLVMAGVMSPMVPDLEKLRIQLLALPNVAHVGVLPPDKLSILIDGSIAGLVAYPFEPKQEKPSQPYGSLKPLTYLTHSKPVITTINCYIPELTGKGVYKVENRDEFITAVQQAAEGGIGVDKSTTERYLDEVSYGKLIVKILQAIPPIGV